MYTHDKILEEIKKGNIVIEPFDPKSVGTNSVDVHLGDTITFYTDAILDPFRDNPSITFKIPDEGYVLEPNKLYLANTREYTETHAAIPCYDGRSSFGRLGLFSHVTAGFGDIGFCGQWTLEIVVPQPLRIYPGLRIGQIYYYEPDGPLPECGYSGKYQGSRGTLTSRMFTDREAPQNCKEDNNA